MSVPQNGIQGLKEWQHDLRAGLLVSMVSLPLSLGIAIASGAPPVTGLTSAVVAGLVAPFLGGSYVTISGPAAGLAPALLAGMLALGHGDAAAGYPLILCAIVLVGLIQVVLARLKAANIAAVFPSAVIEGMLCAIGLMLIVKQLPLLCGHPFRSHAMLGMIEEAPADLLHGDPRTLGLGLACLAFLTWLQHGAPAWVRKVPPQLTTVAAGAAGGWMLGLDPALKVSFPKDLLSHWYHAPAWQTLWSTPGLWYPLAVIVVTLVLIDGTESLATAAAFDRVDPYHRSSDPNRTLQAMGVSNILSGLIGGLTIIPGGIKSTTNVVAGGRTLWANFYNAVFLVLYLLALAPVVSQIPLCALAAMLVTVGYKLAGPHVWKHVRSHGRDQLLLFATTSLLTLCTGDLLVGIVAGIALKLLMQIFLVAPSLRPVLVGAQDPATYARQLMRIVGSLLRSPLQLQEDAEGCTRILLNGPLTCFAAVALRDTLAAIPAHTSRLTLMLGDEVTYIDHTSMRTLHDCARELRERGVHVDFGELERLHPFAPSTLAARLRPELASVDSVLRAV